MRHLVLSGNFDLTVDDKNRILVPSEVRKKLDPERDGEAFFLVTGRDGRLWLYPERYYEQLISREPTELTPSEDTMAFDRMMLGLASRVEWDKQGRVLLPDRQLKRAGIGKDVTLVGARDHLELWNRADWDAEREQLEARRADVIEKIRQQREKSRSE
ncbi:MAG: transcriptional regulator MraZ [Phycisphaerales bacterium]|nr:transcriptional regulator MraZ [Phycisphaerales bacterium]